MQTAAAKQNAQNMEKWGQGRVEGGKGEYAKREIERKDLACFKQERGRS